MEGLLQQLQLHSLSGLCEMVETVIVVRGKFGNRAVKFPHSCAASPNNKPKSLVFSHSFLAYLGDAEVLMS